jgi:hypothetical protein
MIVRNICSRSNEMSAHHRAKSPPWSSRRPQSRPRLAASAKPFEVAKLAGLGVEAVLLGDELRALRTLKREATLLISTVSSLVSFAIVLWSANAPGTGTPAVGGSLLTKPSDCCRVQRHPPDRAPVPQDDAGPLALVAPHRPAFYRRRKDPFSEAVALRRAPTPHCFRFAYNACRRVWRCFLASDTSRSRPPPAR